MFAIIPAAGRGVRLKPLTDTAPKALLPVYNKPMIFYPLLLLKKAGIFDIVMIVNPEDQHLFKSFFKDGKDLGLKIRYALQEKPLGIAHAVYQARDIARNEKIIVIHNDNIFEDDLTGAIQDFAKQSFNKNGREVGGAKIILKEVHDPKRFGVAELKDGLIVSIEEKPENPKSNWITTGIYMFDERVFDIFKTLKPSARGEYEITDLVNFYVKEGTLTYEKIKGAWFDVGTIEALQEASNYVAENAYLREQRLLS